MKDDKISHEKKNHAYKLWNESLSTDEDWNLFTFDLTVPVNLTHGYKTLHKIYYER